MYPNSLVMMCPLFLNLLASIAFYLHMTTEGYLDFVYLSLSKYNNSIGNRVPFGSYSKWTQLLDAFSLLSQQQNLVSSGGIGST